MKLSKKEIKRLKNVFIAGILSQMASKSGYECVLWNAETEERELIIVNQATRYLPDYWQAGITNGVSFRFGADLARIEFASEEAKRMVRDMFPDQAGFITWAWYN